MARRRDGAAVDRVEIPTRRQNIRPAARRRTRWSGRHEPPIEALHESSDFGVTTSKYRRLEARFDFSEDGEGLRPVFRTGDFAGDEFRSQEFDALDRIALRAPRSIGNVGENIGA